MISLKDYKNLNVDGFPTTLENRCIKSDSKLIKKIKYYLLVEISGCNKVFIHKKQITHNL